MFLVLLKGGEGGVGSQGMDGEVSGTVADQEVAVTFSNAQGPPITDQLPSYPWTDFKDRCFSCPSLDNRINLAIKGSTQTLLLFSKAARLPFKP